MESEKYPPPVANRAAATALIGVWLGLFLASWLFAAVIVFGVKAIL